MIELGESNPRKLQLWSKWVDTYFSGTLDDIDVKGMFESVQRGAERLDQFSPGWHTDTTFSGIAFYSVGLEGADILSKMYGTRDAGLEALGLTPDMAYEHGFDCASEEWKARSIEVMNLAWIGEILKRRGPTEREKMVLPVYTERFSEVMGKTEPGKRWAARNRGA